MHNSQAIYLNPSPPLLSSPLSVATSPATTAALSWRQLLQRQPLLSLLSLDEALLSVLSSQLKLGLGSDNEFVHGLVKLVFLCHCFGKRQFLALNL
ncbi:hypothetical protein FCM35_KLT00931 [Carex littledalei]|uniref:Uncharacterized protein n=1 Tax=Carex littledalei TaxID=544730 RepID=A0A833VMQ8_9POAL|nr:hypothetical protein FCM35_KLT00931 [Carex littledalei]